MDYPRSLQQRIEFDLMRQAEMVEERLRQDRLAAEKAKSERDAFLRAIAEAMRPVIRQELEAVMATKTIGKIKMTNHKTGKITVSPIAKMPLHRKIAVKAKADRTEKRLRANRKGAA